MLHAQEFGELDEGDVHLHVDRRQDHVLILLDPL